MAGRAKHMETSEKCRKWWQTFSKDAKAKGLQDQNVASSSEVGSDNDSHCLTACNVDVSVGLELDTDANGIPTSNLNDETNTDVLQVDHGNFTSLPWGVDLRPADAISEAELIITVEEFTGAAHIFDECKNLYTHIWENDGLYEKRKQGGPYYPFSGAMEWEVVEWLQTLDVPMERIDHFFQLDYVCFLSTSDFIYADVLIQNNRSNADLSRSLQFVTCACG